MSDAAPKKGSLTIAIGMRPKGGGSYGSKKEPDGDESSGSASYESEGQQLIDAIDKGDAGAVGAAMAAVAKRCMMDEA